MENKEQEAYVLSDQIKFFNQRYREGDPEISDKEYDILVARLKELDPENEWFKEIEPINIPDSRKEQLPIQMRSLDKVKSMDELRKWFKKFGLHDGISLVIMPKYDGISLLTRESTGECWTRGGEGNEGMQSKDHFKKTNSITNKIFQYTYGEAIISNQNWADHFEGRTNPRNKQPYKSARNTVSGLFRQDTPSEEMQYVDYVRYGVAGVCSEDFDYFSELLSVICDCYEQPRKFVVTTVKDITEESLLNIYLRFKTSYEIDGLVIYVNDLELQNMIGRHPSTGNPQYAIAYKGGFEELKETEVLDINVKVSKSGALKPTVAIEPVELASATITNPTGYNMKWICDMGLAKGAKVVIKRSGEVIPKIMKVSSMAPSKCRDELRFRTSFCPSCGCRTEWNSSKVEIICSNESCQGRILAKIIHFFNTVGCDGLGEETFNTLFDYGFDTIKKILDISITEIIRIDGFGLAVAKTITDNNFRIKQGIALPVLMHASDCFDGIGQTKATSILDSLSDKDMHYLINGYSITGKEAVTKTMESFYRGVFAFHVFCQSNDLKLLPYKTKVIEENPDGELYGANICFSNVRDKVLEKQIEAKGGKIVSGVSKKTTHLIVADVNGNTDKIKKARELGITICSIVTFKENI